MTIHHDCQPQLWGLHLHCSTEKVSSSLSAASKIGPCSSSLFRGLWYVMSKPNFHTPSPHYRNERNFRRPLDDGRLTKTDINKLFHRFWSNFHRLLSYPVLCQNRVLIVCMTQDQMFHTYGQKCSQITKCHSIEYIYYINNVFKN
jgi:hypothetical protein